MKKIFTFVLTAAVIFTALGCGGTREGTSPSGGSKTLRFSYAGDPITLDASKVVDNLSTIALYYSQTMLMRQIGDVYEPDGAVSMDLSNDGLTVTFTIRDGLVWADGTPLTAEHYAYSLTRRLDPNTGFAGANRYYPIRGAEEFNMGRGSVEAVGVSAPDAKTLVIELYRHAPTFYDELKGLMPIRADICARYGESYGSSVDAYLSSGPYILTSWEYQQSLTFVKNDSFWNAENVNITELRWVTVIDTNATVNLFEAGELDQFLVNDEMTFNRYPDAVKGSFVQSGGNFLQFNFGNQANPVAGRVLENRNFRLALSYALDRKPLVNALRFSNEADERLVIPVTPTVNGTWGETYRYTANPVNADPVKAKEYLDAAFRELGISSASNLPRFTFVLFDNPLYRSYSEAMVDAWERVLGITGFDITVLPIPQAIERCMSGQFDIYITGLTRTADPYVFYQMLAVGGVANWGEWKAMYEFTDMLEATNTIFDEKQRQDALFECEKFFDEHGYVLPLWAYGGKYLVRPEVKLTGHTVSAYYYPNIQFVYADVAPDAER